MTITEEMQKNLKYLNPFLFADFVGQPIHIIDGHGILIYVNKSWVNTYQVEPRLIIGKHVSKLTNMLMEGASFSFEISSDKIDALSDIKPEMKVLNQCSPESPALIALREKRQVTFLCHEKNDYYSVCQSSPIYDGYGNIIYVLTFIQNISVYSNWQSDLENLSTSYLPEILNELKNVEFSHLKGNSPEMLWVKHLISLVAKSDATVLITGESGCGKEIVAKEIVAHSIRKNKPFLSINCSAIPENLMESEIFGHEKGAFTGAAYQRKGLFEQADGGTILLDEIGEMPMHLQTKLLRVLQEKKITRIGGQTSIDVDVRIIASTNVLLSKAIEIGTFRSDLYYRLNVFPIELPPLRNRGNDIQILAKHFVQTLNQKYNAHKTLSPQDLRILTQYNWPGNVRELENFIERLFIISPDDIIPAKLISELLGKQLNSDIAPTLFIEDDLSLKEMVENYEREIITHALDTYGSTHKAAAALKCSQPTIVRKIKMLNIVRD